MPEPVIVASVRTAVGKAGRGTATERELPAGTLRVDMTQPLARLAFYLLEPMSDDGVANWNLVDGLELDARTYPILRSAQ